MSSGIDPSSELQQLYAQILRQERSLKPAAAGSTADHYADVIKALLAARVVPVLGPGAIVAGRPGNAVWEKTMASFPPGAEDAAAHLAREFGFPPERADALSRVSQFVAVTRGIGPLYDELNALFARDYEPGPVHRLLATVAALLGRRSLPRQLIVTSSYDRMVERAFADAEEKLDVVSYIATKKNREATSSTARTMRPRE